LVTSALRLPFFISICPTLFLFTLRVLYLLSISWLKWSDPIVDTFRDLWVPLQLLQGHVLYGDLFYEYGFLPPFLLAIFYAIAGGSISTMVAIGILFTGLETLILFNLARLFLNRFLSLLFALNFLFVFAFGLLRKDTALFCYIISYSYSTLLFLLFASTALFFFIRFLNEQRIRLLLYWSIILSLAFLCRPEMTFLLWLTFVFIAVYSYILYNTSFRHPHSAVYILSPFLIALTSYLLFLLSTHSLAAFHESVIRHVFYQLSSRSPFTSTFFGASHIWRSKYFSVNSFFLRDQAAVFHS
jgi:hypothetical protein